MRLPRTSAVPPCRCPQVSPGAPGAQGKSVHVLASRRGPRPSPPTSATPGVPTAHVPDTGKSGGEQGPGGHHHQECAIKGFTTPRFSRTGGKATGHGGPHKGQFLQERLRFDSVCGDRALRTGDIGWPSLQSPSGGRPRPPATRGSHERVRPGVFSRYSSRTSPVMSLRGRGWS